MLIRPEDLLDEATFGGGEAEAATAAAGEPLCINFMHGALASSFNIKHFRNLKKRSSSSSVTTFI